MSTNMDYAKAKHQRQSRGATRATPDTASTTGWTGPAVSLRGWRTEWDGDPFPVTVTRSDIRTPDAESAAA